MEEERNSRFNGKAARWHGLLWLVVIVLVCVGWTLFLSGCSTKKTLASDISTEKDSLVVRSSSSSLDSSKHDSTLVIVSEKNHSQLVHDSVFVSQVIERETIIRQDSTGKEISRENSTTITNNRDRVREIEQMFSDVSSSNTSVNNRVLKQRNTSNDSISSKVSNNNKIEETIEYEQVKIWERVKNFFRFVWGLILFCLQALVIGVVVYMVGIIAIRLYRWIKNILPSKRKE